MKVNRINKGLNMEENKKRNFLSAKEVAEYFGVSRQTIHTWTHGGLLNGKKVLGRIFYTEEDVMKAQVPVTEFNISKKSKPISEDERNFNRGVFELATEKFLAILSKRE